MVQTIGTGKGWTQSSEGVPGTVESGDRLGASLGGSPATGATRSLVGIPGEDASTGAVLVGLPVGGSSVSYLKGTRWATGTASPWLPESTGHSASGSTRSATDADRRHGCGSDGDGGVLRGITP